MTLQSQDRRPGPQRRGPFGLLLVPENRPLSESALFAGYRNVEDQDMKELTDEQAQQFIDNGARHDREQAERSARQNQDVIYRLEATLRFARSGPDGRTAGRTLRLYRVAAGVSNGSVAEELRLSEQAITNMEQRGAEEGVVERFIVAVDELTRADL